MAATVGRRVVALALLGSLTATVSADEAAEAGPYATIPLDSREPARLTPVEVVGDAGSVAYRF